MTSDTPHERYRLLMSIVRERLDTIRRLAETPNAGFAYAEAAAFHGRKVVEGMAFGCLIGTENGLAHVPRDAKGQWNAENILASLDAKKIVAYPYAATIREATCEEAEGQGVKSVIEAVRSLDIPRIELIAIYRRLHSWLHELNPYTSSGRSEQYARSGQALWTDLDRIDRLLTHHLMSINGQAFFCTLRDSEDGTTKVLSLSRSAQVAPEAA